MIAMLSDIHGNYPALMAALDEIDRLGCSQIFSLGDVAGYYCMINKCIERLRDREIINLMGNHDNYLVSSQPCPRSNTANVCLKYQHRSITKRNLKWLSQSCMSHTCDGISMVHAGWNDPLDEYLDHVSSEYFSGRDYEFFFSGHTHVQIQAHLNGKLYCNPGSIGQPRDGDPRAAFAVFDGEHVFLRRVDYDINEIAFEMNRAGFEEYCYENLYRGTCIGGKCCNVTVQSDTGT